MKKNKMSPKDAKQSIDTTPVGSEERDLDDLVHEESKESHSDLQGEDLDDKVHRTLKPATSGDLLNPGLEDPDDLVHGLGNDEDDH